ncbi:MAG: hypothetical protein M1837_007241 [Sclerophora amabilis]|nr:MAG: hypothetical protein M1837_007241 [Sclerophora amabilis]
MSNPMSSLPSPVRKPSSSSNTSLPAAGGGGLQTDSPARHHTASARPALNARSCVTCRRRKVKCDKRSPCSNCSRANKPCTFPSPGRAPRRNPRSQDQELFARLHKLEGMVQELNGAQEDGEPSSSSRKAAMENGRPLTLDSEGHPKSWGRETGRLVVDEGKSRYVSSSFWASLSDHVQDMKEILSETAEEDEDVTSPESGTSPGAGAHNDFIFNFSSLAPSLRSLHPNPGQIDFLWGVFVTNVDPMIKILHKPTMEKALQEAKDNLDGVSRGMEAMMFAIYLAALTSISAEECRAATGESQETAIARYRFATEQALARASFLTTHEMITLQAFVIFLVVIRRHDETRLSWTLTGLAARLAQSLGLHRDGEAFGLSPFVTEMRRRLWWHVLILDIRSAEDHGSDPSITEGSFDTKYPLNIDDDEMSVDSEGPLKNHHGCTEMTFCLVRYEVTGAMRKLNFVPPVAAKEASPEATVKEKERWIEETCRSLDEKFNLKGCDMTVPLYWVTATVARLILGKMWLMLHHPFQRLHKGAPIPQETKDHLFVTSMEVIEYARLLETEPTTRKYCWLLRTYVQWHAIVFLLAELCLRTRGELVDRAWHAVNGVFENWGEQAQATKNDMLWLAVKRLRSRAQRARDLELARDGVIKSLSMSTDGRVPGAPSSIATGFRGTSGNTTTKTLLTASPEEGLPRSSLQYKDLTPAIPNPVNGFTQPAHPAQPTGQLPYAQLNPIQAPHMPQEQRPLPAAQYPPTNEIPIMPPQTLYEAPGPANNGAGGDADPGLDPNQLIPPYWVEIFKDFEMDIDGQGELPYHGGVGGGFSGMGGGAGQGQTLGGMGGVW